MIVLTLASKNEQTVSDSYTYILSYYISITFTSITQCLIGFDLLNRNTSQCHSLHSLVVDTLNNSFIFCITTPI